MKNKLAHFVGILQLTSLSLLLSLPALAGTNAGNGDYCEQKGAQCNRVKFEISGSHPQHSRLVDLIERTELPRNLKHEMLTDLQRTQVVYSGEKIRYKDLLARYEFELTEKSSETLRDRNGKIISIKEFKKWERQVRLPNLGIYLNHDHVGYQVGDEDKLWVRAITQTNPGKVIYFTPFIEKMTTDEVLKLVLHEQGHRLNFLAILDNDERAIEGWASELLSYLQGKIRKEQFYRTMEAFKLNVTGRFSLGKRHRAGPTMYYSDFSVVLAKDSIVASESQSDFSQRFGISMSAFQDYPGLNTKDQILWVQGLDMIGIGHVDAYFNAIRDGGHTKTLNLRAYYHDKGKQLNDTFSSSDVLQHLEPSTSHVEEMYLNTQAELNAFFESLPKDYIAPLRMRGDWAVPHREIYARPELLFMPNFSDYQQNAQRMALSLVQQLRELKAKGDLFADYLKTQIDDQLHCEGRGNFSLSKSNGKLFDSDTTRSAAISPILIAFTAEEPKLRIQVTPKIKVREQVTYYSYECSWNQIQFFVNSQMTDEQIRQVVYEGIESARVYYSDKGLGQSGSFQKYMNPKE